MDNLSNFSNFTSAHPLNNPGFVVFNVVMLLGVVFPVFAVNRNKYSDSGGLGLRPIHCKCNPNGVGKHLDLLPPICTGASHVSHCRDHLLPFTNPPTTPCTITIFLIGFGGGARLSLAFMATFAVVVYLVVKYGETPKKHFVVASFITVVVLIIAFLGNSPLLSQKIISTWYAGYLYCGISPTATSTYVYIGLCLVCFGLTTISVTVTILVITVCYTKRLTVKDVNLEKITVKFGFFLLLGNGINLLGQNAAALISASVTPQPTPPWPDGQPLPAAVTYIPYTFLNIALIPTHILVLIFNPIRERLAVVVLLCAKGQVHS